MALLLSWVLSSRPGCQMLKGVLMPALRPCWSLKKGLLVGSVPLSSAPEDDDPAAEAWWLGPCALTLL